jgi:hypothetical protein
MTKRYFKKEDVDALIPELHRIMGPVMEAHQVVASLTAELGGEQQRIAMAGGGMIDRVAWEEKKATIARRTEEVQNGLRRVMELGGAPKDVSLGLVDFASMRGGQDVNLCWRYGESTVGFWHRLDEGYAARRPL